MSNLGALLELIHDAHSRVTNLEAEYRDWMKAASSLELHIERSEVGDTHARWRGGGPFPQAVASNRRIWLKAPHSLRVEIVNGNELVRLGVLNKERWWRWDLDSGPVTGELVRDQPARGTPPPPLLAPPVLNPVSLLPFVRFDAVGSAVRTGRDVMTARAVPRGPHSDGLRASYEFDFDAEHGTVLRRAALNNGELLSVTEAIAISYECEVESHRFRFISPDGQPVRDVQAAVVT